MDETFEEVDFSYVSKSTGENFSISTLEEIENEVKPTIQQTEVVENNQSQKSENINLSLEPGQKIIRDNQSGISYDNLFGAYLLNATDFNITDPYIRLPYQLRNFMELAKLISEKKDPDTEVKLHLVTSNNEDFIENAKDAFEQMRYSLESMGIIFSYEFDDFIHDRSIEMNNGWKVILGRGLDIWQKTGGWYDINEYIQERRVCKACEITFVRS
jgi:ATP-dependent Lon protease